MAQLEALLFDVDGTLADTERDGHRVAFNRAFERVGLDWRWSVAMYGELLAVTGGKERMRRYIERHVPASWTRPSDLDAFIAELHATKTRAYLDIISSGEVVLRPGVERLLAEARAAGIRLGIATTTTPKNVDCLLRATLGDESLDWFEVIAAGDIVPAKKPASDIYTYACEQMSVAPRNCLALEDSDNGLRAALGAGIATVVTVNGYTRAQDFTGAALVLDMFGELHAPATLLGGGARAAFTPPAFNLDAARSIVAAAA